MIIFSGQGMELIPGFKRPVCVQNVINEVEPKPTTTTTVPTTVQTTEPTTIKPEPHTSGSALNSFTGILLTYTAVILFNF